MKITMNVECSPEEMRQFLGLPDVQPMQDALMKEIEQRLLGNMKAMDPQNLARAWMPMGVQGMEQMQKLFWSQMQQGMTNAANVTNNVTSAISSLVERQMTK